MAEEQFYTILTNVGKAKIANATLLNSNLTLKTLKVGDGNGTYYNPTEDQEDLKNTVHECAIGAIYIDKKNPNWIISETIIPGSVGGFTIREVGLFDAEGDMIAVGKYPETYKPVVANGASKDLNVRTIFEVSNAENVTLNLDPSVIIATKEDINNLQEQIDENTAQLKDLANPNILINGDFQVWQRGISFNGESYTADRWRVAQGNTTLSTLNNKNAIRITRTSSDTSETNLEYKMENLQTMKGKTYTLSWEGMANVNVTYSTLIFFIGDNGSKEFLNSEDKDYVSNVTTKHSITFTLPDDIDSEYTILGIRILRRATVNEHTITVTNIKMEVGSLATPFIPRLYGEELALCKRYYEPLLHYKTFGVAMTDPTDGTILSCSLEYSPKRITPSITFGAQDAFGIPVSSGAIASKSIAVLESNIDRAQLQVRLNGSTTPGQAFLLQRNDSSNDSSVYVDAEIY